MPSLIKPPMVYIVLLVVVAALGIFIYLNDSDSSINEPLLNGQSDQLDESSEDATNLSKTEKPLAQEPPSDFPTSAKKLHKLIHGEAQSSLAADELLEQRQQQLDKELTDIEKELVAQGLKSQTQQQLPPETLPEIQKRLDAIKQHLQKNETNQN